MNTRYGRLLITVVVGAWLLGLMATGALAGLTLSCSLSEATSNSVWNWLAVWTDSADPANPNGVSPTLDPTRYRDGVYDSTIGTIRQPIQTVWADTMTWMPVMPRPDGFTCFPTPGEVLPREAYKPNGHAFVQPDPSDDIIDEGDGAALYDHGLDYVNEYGISTVYQYISLSDTTAGLPIPAALDAAPADAVGGVVPEKVIGVADPNYVVALERSPDVNSPISVWSDQAHTLPVQAVIAAASDANTFWKQTYNVIETTEPTGIPPGTTHLYASYSCDIDVPIPETLDIAPGDPDPVTGIIPFAIVDGPTPVIVLERAPDTLVGVWFDAEHTLPLQAALVPANTIDPSWPSYNVIQITDPNGIPVGTTKLYLAYSYNNADIAIPTPLDTSLGDPDDVTGAIPFKVISKYSGLPGVDPVAALTFTDLAGQPVAPKSLSVWADAEHKYPITVQLAPANQVNPAWTQTYDVIDITDPNGIPAGTTRLYVSYTYGTAGFSVATAASLLQPPDPKADGTFDEATISVVDDPSNADPTVTKPLDHPVVILKMPPVALIGVWSDAGHTKPLKAQITTASQAGLDNGLTGTPATASLWKNWTYPVLEIMDEGGLPTNKIYISYYTAGTHYVFTQRNMLTPPYTAYPIPLVQNTDPYLTINDAIVRFDPLRVGIPDNGCKPDEFGLMGIYLNPQLTGTNYYDLNAFDPGNLQRYDNTLRPGYGLAYFSSPLPPSVGPGTTLYAKVSTNAVDGVWTKANHAPTDTDHYRYADGSVIGYCAHSGIIRLANPLPAPSLDPDTGALDMGQQCYVTYRYMTPGTFTVGRSPDLGFAEDIDNLRPPLPQGTTYTFDPKKVTISQGNGKFTISDPTGLPPYGTYACRISYELLASSNVSISSAGTPHRAVWLNGTIPMNYVSGDPAHGGEQYRVSVSAGLNMFNPKQRPNANRALNGPIDNPTLIFDQYRYPMYYTPNLVPSNPDPTCSAVGYMVKGGALISYSSSDISVHVHGSSGNFSSTGGINYGGGGNEDFLTIYGDNIHFPQSVDVDPLSVEPVEEAVANTPDDGSSSTMFVFRVHYNGSLPPKPWGGVSSGVVLYLDPQGTGDYQPYPMQPDYEQPGLNWTGSPLKLTPVTSSVYQYRVIPHHAMGITGAPPAWAIEPDRLYRSMQMGVYHYFFACSDDSLTFSNGSYVLTHQANPAEWGATGGPYNSTGLDPTDPRSVAGYPAIERAAHRRYTSDGLVHQSFSDGLDTTLYVDRPTRAPGFLEFPTGGYPLPGKYPVPSSEHPLVTCELHMPPVDEFGNKGFDDASYGYARFFGTLYPYTSAVNPAHRGAHDIGRGEVAQLAETSGSRSSDANIFRIMYMQYQNKPPVSIKLWLNNASEKSGTDAAHQFRSYTMQRRADQVSPNYVTGVWYEYKLQSLTTDLPAGPHSYYFTANDGQHTVRWPVRPDLYFLDNDITSGTIADWWVPTRNKTGERNNTPNSDETNPAAGYFDNDYVPGPFVNSAPRITNVSVTPSAGREGTHFIYKCTYSDADGQRINNASVTIQVDDAGTTRTFDMSPDPKYHLDPAADNSALYKSGIDLILDTGTIQDLALAKGVRKFFIQVTDDWGYQFDVNDLRPGETVRYPAGNGNWVQGPVISGNTAPTLYNGHVDSMDNTANSATIWSFKVTYRDIDRDAPGLIKVFIGREQPADPTATTTSKVKTVLWDAGHTMLPTDPNDTVYSHGVVYSFQTRLAGPEDNLVGTETQPAQYYYAFEAYDGVDYATYNNSSQVDQRSDAAGCFIRQDAQLLPEVPSTHTHFKITPKIARQVTLDASTLNAGGTAFDPDSGRLNDIVAIWGVYRSEDLDKATGADLVDDPSGHTLLSNNWYIPATMPPPSYNNTTHDLIPLNGLNPSGKVWVVVEAYTPMVGPLSGLGAAPAGIISDAEVFRDFVQSGTPLLITDQQNGFISEDGTDKAIIMQNGTAIYQGRPSGEYILPDGVSDIASVEGVYWRSDSSSPWANYYNKDMPPALPTDPNTSLVPPVYRNGVLDFEVDQLGQPVLDPNLFPIMTAQLTDPEEVYKVFGVFENPELTGVNHYLGYLPLSGMREPLWQQAFIINARRTAGSNVIWPTHPNEIASINGVFMTMSLTDILGNFLPPDDPTGATNPTPYVVPGIVDAVTGDITIDAAYNVWGAIQRILEINDKADMSGTDYYVSVDPAGDPYDPTAPIVPNTGSLPSVATVWVSYVPAVNFGPDHELMCLKTPLPVIPNPVPPATRQTSVYIAYYPPGDLTTLLYPPGTPDSLRRVVLDIPFAQTNLPAYVKIWPKAFNPGITRQMVNPDGTYGADPADGYIKLTTKLPDMTADTTVTSPGLVTIDPAVVGDIGAVTGVFMDNDVAPINYYVGTRNPYTIGDTVVRLGAALPDPLTGAVHVSYLPKNRQVLIKYNDMRFTHLFTGAPAKIGSVSVTRNTTTGLFEVGPPTMSPGTTHFVPSGINGKIVNGVAVDNINITGNDPILTYDDTTQPPTLLSTTPRDICGGIVGMWLDFDLTGINYFNPRRTGLYADNAHQVRLQTDVPDGTQVMYAKAYQKGLYFLDRWNHELRFEPVYAAGDPADPTTGINDLTRIQVSYFFGTKMPQTLVKNTPPELSNGTVVPISGSRNAQYVYSVKYKDIDGPTGQIPTYVRVYIDGVPHDMAPANQGTPDYKQGATFTFTPTGGLSSEKHSFYFEASDGAAVAWFDKFGGHISVTGVTPHDIVEMEGPWVNDPPTLLNGLVSPNPAAPAGIGTQDSVDYRVTLMDVDNDPPYFFDPLRDLMGQNVSGSPRAWIDAGLSEDTAAPVFASIVGLEADPLEVTKMRVIVAKVDDGAGHLIDPHWATDQYAGKLMQISNGDTWSDISPSPFMSVYLIQSNTSNRMVIAADTLANDKLWPVPADPQTGAARYAQFRINGLLMSKVDPQQQNFTLGVDYKITVPRLPVGIHKFHFTARTRENKPDWLLAIPTTDQAPYSIMVRFPTLGDLTGPTVISQPSKDNVAPVLSRVAASPSSTLYRGPQAQTAVVTSPTTVLPTDCAKLLNVLGVYRNANFDAHLIDDPALPLDQRPKNLYESASTTPPDCNTDQGLMTLTTSLSLYPITDSTRLVQRSSKVVNSLTVEPDVAGAIDSVVGVFLTSDPTLLTPYSVASPNLDAHNRITLNPSSPLPVGTTDVYILYRPKTVVQPPVYIKNYAQEPAGSPSGTPPLHGTFIAGEPLTFEIFYQDANGDRPTYHDGVQGYVKLVFNDSGRTAQLLPLIPPTDYRVGVPFGVTLTDVPEGQHSYHFEASDGYVVTRFPVDQTGTAPLDEKVKINYKPVLSSPGVDHSSGATTFTFSVRYQDRDGVAPHLPNGIVQVILTNRANPALDPMVVTMTPQGIPNYSAGAVYTGVADLSAATWPEGIYDAMFVANDGLQAANQLPGPIISKRIVPADYHPLITDYQVYKALPGGGLGAGAGKSSDTFVYRARYKDIYNDAPVATFNGIRQSALSLVIDGDTAHPIPMTMVPIAQPDPPAPPIAPDYTGTNAAAWPWWEARITGRKLGGGNHNYTVFGSDGTVSTAFDIGVPPLKYGPILMIPYFRLQLAGKDTSTITDQAIVGQEVLIEGEMYFPYTQADQRPNTINNIIIQVTKPDGTVVALNASLGTTSVVTDSHGVPVNWVGTIQVQYSGYVDPALVTGQSLTLVASGQWIIDAIWPGDSLYDGAQTDSVFDGHNDQVRLNVSGPSRTVAVANSLFPESSLPVVDMITPPMMIGSTSPGGIFGFDRALTMQIVKWVSSQGRYYRYDVGGYFPPLSPGDAVWIKPKLGSGTPGSGYPAPESITQSSVNDGWTALDNPAVEAADVGGSPRYLLNQYRLVKVLAQAYPLKLDAGGVAVLDPETKLPLLKPCSIPLTTGWNQFGNIFFNWKRTFQAGNVPSGPPPPPGDCQDYGRVAPTDPTHISRVLGVYTTATPAASDTNYYQPGIACQPYIRGDAAIHLTQALPSGVTSVFIKYEVYPKVDVGIPISEVQVTSLGVTKSLADAKAAGWLTDYAWRYDTILHDYVAVSDTRVGAERVLKAWSGYWIRAFVDCQIQIDPNTTFNGVSAARSAARSVSRAAAQPTVSEDMDAPPPAPD